MTADRVTYAEAAALLGCTERTIYRLVADGKLRAEPMCGGHRSILKTEIDRYLREGPWPG